mmetsp:Transcript_57637/g.153514  ORF Transcript_57637/g.153514 Transcript_57637/m.153514 type:complete len:292 (+) Transcript_57637:1293-2168(+)
MRRHVMGNLIHVWLQDITQKLRARVNHQVHHVQDEGQQKGSNYIGVPSDCHEQNPVIHVNQKASEDSGPKCVVVSRIVDVHAWKSGTCQQEQDDGVHHCDHQVERSLSPVQVFTLAAPRVEQGVLEDDLFRNILVEATSCHDGKRAEEIERQPDPIFEQGRAREARHNGVHGYHHHLYSVSPEGVQGKLGHAFVVPATMYQQETCEIPELTYGKVGVVYCLKTFTTSHAHSNLRFLNHRHVIRTIANGHRHRCRLDAPTDQTDHLSLLQRRNSACDDDIARHRDFVQELLL